MASSVIKNETATGLTPIFVSKRVILPAQSVTEVDLSEFIPQGKYIRAISTIKLGNYLLPYFSGDNNPTFLREMNGNALFFDNRASIWDNYMLTAIIYV